VPFRLLGNDPELYGEYDRLRSEGEFRLAVADPSIILIVTLAIISSPVWLYALIGVIILEVLGIRKVDASTALLIDAIRAGRVTGTASGQRSRTTMNRTPAIGSGSSILGKAIQSGV
jgi:xanthine/uracil/vitamin C permease (AzgA family)